MPHPVNSDASRAAQSGALRRCARTVLASLLVISLTAPALAQRPDREDDRHGPDRSNDDRGERDRRGRRERTDPDQQAEPGRRADQQYHADRADRERRGEQQRTVEPADQQRRSEMQHHAEVRDERDHREDRREDRRDEQHDDWRNVRPDERRDWDHRNDRLDHDRRDWRPNGGWHRDRNIVIYRGRPVIVRPDRRRIYRDIVVLRPYGHFYYGYGRYYRDDDAWRFLGLSAITFALLDVMSEAQQRALEDAQIRATEAPVGEPIFWEERGAEGMVVTAREGHTRDGRYCREFRQEVTIGGRREEAYGTACQQPDGSWQVVDD